MSRQSSIVKYLKVNSVSETAENTNGISKKRQISSDNNTNTITPIEIKRTFLNCSEENVIDLCSDDDEPLGELQPKIDLDNSIHKITLPDQLNALCEITPEKIPKRSNISSLDECSSSSKNPLIMQENSINENIVQGLFQDAPKTPQKKSTPIDVSPDKYSPSRDHLVKKNLAEELFQDAPRTPQKKKTPTISSKDKYYSPAKNRVVKKRSPVKKNLVQDLFQDAGPSQDIDSSPDEMVDDKIMILLTNIKNMLKDSSLFNLLDETSQDILNKCLLVDTSCLKLVCKLYWRQHLWYRFNKLFKMCQSKENNIDSSAVHLYLNTLVENGLLEQSSLGGMDSLPFEDLLNGLSAVEIKQICKDFKINIKSKYAAVKSLLNFCQQRSISVHFNGNFKSNKERVVSRMQEKLGVRYKLSDLTKSAIYKLYLIMYLGINYNIIRENKLEWTIIYDKIKKETFPINKTMVLDNATCVFNSREEFESYLKAHLIYETFLAETHCEEKCKIVENVYESYKNILHVDMNRYISYPEWLRKYTPAYVYIKILERGVDDLKRQKKSDAYLLAVDILTTLIEQKTFRRYKVGSWYAEKALLLHKYLRRHDECFVGGKNHLAVILWHRLYLLQTPDSHSDEQYVESSKYIVLLKVISLQILCGAALLLIDGFKSDISEEAKEIMQPRAILISKQQNTYISEELRESLRSYATTNSKMEHYLPSKSIAKQPIDNYGKKGKIKFEVRTDDTREFMDVEDYCIYYYKTFEDYTHAHHWEGKIVNTIYHLLFWDIIYTNPYGVSGLFLTYYQRYPLDMCHESFYSNRQAWIEENLTKISHYTEDQLLEAMKKTWLERPEYEMSGIVRTIGWENVSMVASCLGPKRVAIICKRLAGNYGYAHSGFPDVTAWNYFTKKITFLEVKSDSDKPSLKQIQWMHYLHSNGIDTAFVYIGKNAASRVKSRPLLMFEDCNEDELDI